MRTLDLHRTFNGSLAWDSFFHLSPDGQRQVFGVFAKHAAPSTVLMFNAGPRAVEIVGSYRGDPLYHASLSPDEYAGLLVNFGVEMITHLAEDWQSWGGRTAWVARARSAVARD